MSAPVVIRTGNGTTREFDVTFPYLRREHVKVVLNGTEVPSFSWVNASRIRLDSAPAEGVSVEIGRHTPIQPLHVIQDGRPLPADHYQENLKQALYYAEERSYRSSSEDSALNALIAAERAESAASESAGNAAQTAEDRVATGEDRAAVEGMLNYFEDGPMARYADPDDFGDMAVNDMPPSGVVAPWPTTFEEELNLAMTGGNPDGSLTRFAADDVGSIFIDIPSEEQTNMIASETPWYSYGGTTSRIIPTNFRVGLPGLSVAKPLFTPVRTNLFGGLVWRYIGTEPLYTTLRGSIRALVKTSFQADESYARFILNLRGWNIPDFAKGQGGGQQFLSFSGVGVQEPSPIIDSLGMMDIGAPLSQVRMNSANTYPEKLTGLIENKTFTSSTPTSVDTLEDAPEESYDMAGTLHYPVIIRHYVTEWIDLTGENNRGYAYLFYPWWDGATEIEAVEIFRYSTYGRVQYKKADGTIHYLPSQSDNRNAFRCYYLPRDAVAVRIAFNATAQMGGNSSPRDRDVPNRLRFRRMGAQHSQEFSPCHGDFVDVVFSVQSSVAFYPQGEYALTWYNNVYDGGFNRANGFRYFGGGLEANFAAGKMKKEIASAYYNRRS